LQKQSPERKAAIIAQAANANKETNMSDVFMTWRFSDLASIADHFENKAKQQRNSAEGFKTWNHKSIALRAAATENESVAYLLRHTELAEHEHA
jgi:hypothetical protein